MQRSVVERVAHLVAHVQRVCGGMYGRSEMPGAETKQSSPTSIMYIKSTDSTACTVDTSGDMKTPGGPYSDLAPVSGYMTLHNQVEPHITHDFYKTMLSEVLAKSAFRKGDYALAKEQCKEAKYAYAELQQQLGRDAKYQSSFARVNEELSEAFQAHEIAIFQQMHANAFFSHHNYAQALLCIEASEAAYKAYDLHRDRYNSGMLMRIINVLNMDVSHTYSSNKASDNLLTSFINEEIETLGAWMPLLDKTLLRELFHRIKTGAVQTRAPA